MSGCFLIRLIGNLRYSIILSWMIIYYNFKICSCDSDEDIEVADKEEINEVEEVEDQVDNDSKYIESTFVVIF